jgi:large subunit ribosomal protein L18
LWEKISEEKLENQHNILYMSLKKSDRRNRIRNRIRKIVSGTEFRPRLSVFRSNKEIYAQIINDLSGKTITFASSREKSVLDLGESDKTSTAENVGKTLSERALKLGITEITFDRGGYLYHGRVKALADGARNGGLKF